MLPYCKNQTTTISFIPLAYRINDDTTPKQYSCLDEYIKEKLLFHTLSSVISILSPVVQPDRDGSPLGTVEVL